MDRLEEYIKQNRNELDRYIPSSGILKRVKGELKIRTSFRNHWLSAAVIFIAFAATAVSFFLIGHGWSGPLNEPGSSTDDSYSRAQLKETEIYYKNIVNSLYREATPLLISHPDIEKELREDISHLDSICLDIRKDLKDNVANQDVIEALIRNYRIRIRLLEDMLITLKEDSTSHEKSKKNEI